MEAEQRKLTIVTSLKKYSGYVDVPGPDIFMIPWEDSVDIAGLGTLIKVFGLSMAAFWGVTIVATGIFRKPHP